MKGIIIKIMHKNKAYNKENLFLVSYGANAPYSRKLHNYYSKVNIYSLLRGGKYPIGVKLSFAK